MPNGATDLRIDPSDPASGARFAAAAAAAFQEIRTDIGEIKGSVGRTEAWRIEVEKRLERGSARFEEHGRRIDILDEGLRKMPGAAAEQVRQVLVNVLANPGAKARLKEAAEEPDGGETITFKWLVEKALLPLLMAGAGAGITLLVVRAMGGG